LAIDVGGTSPWSWLFLAIDPDQNVIVYHEIYKATTLIEDLVKEAKPWMADQEGRPYEFKFKCIDAANKIAADDIRRKGITLTNAIKINKLTSIHRLNGYLHPNPIHAFPQWHPLAGQAGSPRLFIMSSCKGLIKELPQQRWKQNSTGTSMKDEPDPNIADHSVDALLYALRQLPPPYDLKPVPPSKKGEDIDLRSKLYWIDVKKQKEKYETSNRIPYRLTRGGINILG
jgi:hypothetical protein